jgi:hypothetical protein
MQNHREKKEAQLKKGEDLMNWMDRVLATAAENGDWDFALLINDFDRLWGSAITMDIREIKIGGYIDIKDEKVIQGEILIEHTFETLRDGRAILVSLKKPILETNK